MKIEIFVYCILSSFVVSLIDIKTRKISNYWSLLHLLLFFVFTAIFKEYNALAFETYKYPLILLSIGFSLFAMGIMGGGDAKYLVTMFLLIPAKSHWVFLYYLLEGTMIIAIFPLTYSIIKNRHALFNGIIAKDIGLMREQFKSKFAYAPVFLLALLRFGWKQGMFQNLISKIS